MIIKKNYKQLFTIFAIRVKAHDNKEIEQHIQN